MDHGEEKVENQRFRDQGRVDFGLRVFHRGDGDRLHCEWSGSGVSTPSTGLAYTVLGFRSLEVQGPLSIGVGVSPVTLRVRTATPVKLSIPRGVEGSGRPRTCGPIVRFPTHPTETGYLGCVSFSVRVGVYRGKGWSCFVPDQPSTSSPQLGAPRYGHTHPSYRRVPSVGKST